jgi:hypothetical protein
LVVVVVVAAGLEPVSELVVVDGFVPVPELQPANNNVAPMRAATIGINRFPRIVYSFGIFLGHLSVEL